MKAEIRQSDLEVLLRTLIGEDYQLFIFDPYLRLINDKAFPLKINNENAPLVLVNLAEEVVGYKNMKLSEFDFIIDFGNETKENNFNSTVFNYIANNDDSMRWVFPASNKTPSFLSFYNASTFKAKLISQSIKLAFKLGLKNFISKGQFTVLHQEKLKPNRDYLLIEKDSYSIFTGTAGLNRTALLEFNKGGQSTHFVKIPLSKESEKLVAKEIEVLNQIKGAFKSFRTPNSYDTKENKECITTNNNKIRERSTDLLPQHLTAISELLENTFIEEAIENNAVYKNSLNNISYLTSNAKSPRHKRIIKLLNGLVNEINTDQTIVAHLAHGDFTPWNMYVSETDLYIYDWELARNEFSPLFDLFHFHFQTGILIHNSSFEKILSKIQESLFHPIIAKKIDQYDINTETALQLYLLGVISYYESLYLKQGVHSEQNLLQFNMWEEALLFVNKNQDLTEEVDCRRSFILEFGNRLEKTPYAMLKMIENSWDEISYSSDLDLAILKGDLENIKNFALTHPLVVKSKTIDKSFMSVIQLFFRDGSFLSIDLIHQLKRKSTDIMSIESFFKNRRMTKSKIFKANLKYDFEYCLLFYLLNNSTIPFKYESYFKNGITEQDKQIIFHYINKKYKLNANNFKELFINSNQLRRKVLSILNLRPENRGMQLIKNKTNYLIDTLKNFTTNKGMIITFSGVDGAGKTTVISNFKKVVEKKYRREVVLVRHRPGILPILSAVKVGKKEAEKQAGVNLPRQGKNKSLISSTLRFGYYFADYLFGQFYIYFKYVLWGKVVLYDRYYFDFINDAKRSNIILNRKLIKRLYAFVWKPNLNFFLYADAEVILKRKQELKSADITSLTHQYQELFDGYNKKQTKGIYQAIQNHDFESTMEAVESSFRQVS